ncbi:hypothetical protein PHSY_000707 [Pseudozyma hubeiensis SY62]|uniref:Uncharacterized protein n=1 Tax=Pseudozyma hubeiensis (strain SY62) TaxID=1305764 RepID=R9NX41_PSEHS|nr:hypothetical protein PHSY_000707 [Pseudozyma hubeiensis SY62]GAC93144.1 hypothetical protein PHSY_000707 [Pseudozyma hubeiensis SY62]
MCRARRVKFSREGEPFSRRSQKHGKNLESSLSQQRPASGFSHGAVLFQQQAAVNFELPPPERVRDRKEELPLQYGRRTTSEATTIIITVINLFPLTGSASTP